MEFGKGIAFYKQPGRPTKKPDDEELLKLYEDHTAPEIAAMYGVESSTVRSWISKVRKSGSPQLLQAFKGSGRQGGRPTVRPDDDELLDLYRVHTATEIGAMYGVKASTVRAWVTKIRRGE